MRILIERAQANDAPVLTEMVGELLREIMTVLGERVFGFDAEATEDRAGTWLTDERLFAWLARDGDGGEVLGFVAVYPGHALYAEGVFGTISELYVRPAYRSRRVGASLLEAVKRFAAGSAWTRVEVTTPPLPQFDRTVSFYERHGFDRSGGYKMKVPVR